jgi:peptide deformylase
MKQTIRLITDPILHVRCKWIKDFTNPAVQQVITDLLDTIPDDGAGLAAPQIGSDLRIAVVRGPHGIQVLINPEITYRKGQRMVLEGCLSVPGRTLLIPRSCVVTVRAWPLSGGPYTIRARDDTLAQALEHEIDHLNGVTLVDHWDGGVRNMRR